MPFLPIDDLSRVAEARRLAITTAREEGLDETMAGDVGLVATEMSTNLWKHSRNGEIHIERLSRRGDLGVEILSIDRGPGMVSLNACLEDGYSTAGTGGTGLGAVARISRVFDAYSEPGKGTVILSRISPPDQRTEEASNASVLVGFAGRPVSGEEVSGDSWGIKEIGPDVLVMLADGLGHGILANDASVEAVSTFKKCTYEAPSAIVENIHRALRGTRGAAVAVARLDLNTRRVHYAGLGNISGIIVGSQKTQSMISHHGTAGHEGKHFQEFVYPFPDGAILVMHSDGLATSWNIASYPGLAKRHPSVIAAVLYRDSSRQRDDVCVVVVKERVS
jgi:anti-sigma regulatory factor (Ser/Thr protein kinase)